MTMTPQDLDEIRARLAQNEAHVERVPASTFAIGAHDIRRLLTAYDEQAGEIERLKAL